MGPITGAVDNGAVYTGRASEQRVLPVLGNTAPVILLGQKRASSSSSSSSPARFMQCATTMYLIDHCTLAPRACLKSENERRRGQESERERGREVRAAAV